MQDKHRGDLQKKDEELRVKMEQFSQAKMQEVKELKKQIKSKYAMIREAQVKEICEKVGEEHFRELQ